MGAKITGALALDALGTALQQLGRIETPKLPTPTKVKTTTRVLPTRDKTRDKTNWFIKDTLIDWDQVWEYQLSRASFKDAVVLSDNTTNPHLLSFYAVSVAYPRIAWFLQ